MELRHLRYFVAVADACSFSRAAETLQVAQSPLSQQIRKLERELGVQLFERTTRSVRLTHAGSVFYERATRLLAGSMEAAEVARRAAHGGVGRLAVGFTGSATYELLPAVARAYHDRVPDVELELHGEMLTPAQVDGLLDERLSVGVLRLPVNADGVVVEVVRQEPLVALLPAQHPVAERRVVELASLRREPFLCYPASPASVMHAAVQQACRQAGFVPRIRQEAAETATLVALVAAGLGVAVVPASVQFLRIAGAAYRPLAPPGFEVSLALAYREGEVSPLVRRFLEIARSVVRSRERAAVRPTADEPADDDASFHFPTI